MGTPSSGLWPAWCGQCGVITWVIAVPTQGFALEALLPFFAFRSLGCAQKQQHSLKISCTNCWCETVTPGDLSCAAPCVTRFLHGQLCSHLLWMHKELFADSWLFLNNFKLLLRSHHCISAPDWMQTRASCPGPGWVEIPCPARPTCGCHLHQWVSTVTASKQLHLISCSTGQFCLNPKTLPIKHLGKGADCQGRAEAGEGSVGPAL